MGQHKRRDHVMKVRGNLYPRSGSIVNRADSANNKGKQNDADKLTGDQLKSLKGEELRKLLVEVSEEIEEREDALDGRAQDEESEPNEIEEVLNVMSVDEQIQLLSDIRARIMEEGVASQRVGFTAQVDVVVERDKSLKELDKLIKDLNDLSIAELERQIEATRASIAGKPTVGFTSRIGESIMMKEYLGELEKRSDEISNRVR